MNVEGFIDYTVRSNVESESKKITKNLKTIEKGQDNLQKEFKETGKAADDTGKRIAKSTGEQDKRFKKVAQSAKSANDSIHGLSGGAKSLGASFSKLKSIGLAAIFTAIGAGLVATVSKFKEFDQAVANLSAITGATGQDLEFLSDKAREFGAVTTLSASQVAEAFQLVASAKPDLLSSKEALAAVTKEAITLAEAAGIGVPEAANTMASALNQFGAEADQAARFTNVLAAGSKFGAASIGEMGEALKFGGVVAGNFGLSFEQTNAALQIFSTNAIKGGEAGTQLRGVLLALETKMSSEFRPSVVGLEKALQNLGDANLSAEEKVKLFGNRNIVAGEILAKSAISIEGNASALAVMEKNLTGTNIAQEQAAARTNTLSGAWSRLKSATEELMLTLSVDTGLGKLLQYATDGLAALVNGVSFAIGGFIDLTKYLWEVSGASEFLSNVFRSTGDSVDYLSGGAEELRVLLGGALVKAFMYLGQVVETTFLVIKNAFGYLTNSVLSLIAVMTDIAKVAGGVFDKAFGTNSAKKMELLGKKVRGLKVELKDSGTIIKDTAKKYDQMRKEVDESTEATLEMVRAQEEAQDSTEKLKKETDEANEKLKEIAESTQDVIDKLDEEIDALGRTSREQDLYNALKEAGVDANTKEGRAIQLKVLELQIEKESLQQINDIKEVGIKKNEDLAKASTKAAEDSAKAWVDSRDGIADFFVDMATNGKASFESIVDNFKGMLIRMVAEYAASGLLSMFGFGGSAGASVPGIFSSLMGAVGSTGGATGGTTGIGSVISGASSVSSLFGSGGTFAGIGGIASNLGTSAYYGLSGMGSIGNFAANNIAGAGQSINGFFGSTGNLGADMFTGGLATAGAGIAGNYVGNAVFGDSKHGGTLGTVGGVAGSIWGPLGSAIGSFIGQGLGKLIGGSNRADKTNQSIDFATGEITRGGSRGHDLDEAAKGVTDTLLAFSESIGGSSADFGIVAHGENGLGFIGADGKGIQSFGEDIEGFFDAAFDKIIEGATNLSDVSKDLAQAFDGSTEELVSFVQSLSAMDELVKSNPIDAAIENYEKYSEQLQKQNEMLSMNSIELYGMQVDSLNTIISAYDGTSLAAEALAGGLIATKESAYALATGILQLQTSLSNMLENSAQSIRDSIKTEEEILESAHQQRNRLRESLHALTSPEEINEAAREIDRLTRLIFDSMSEEQQLANAEKFAQYVERTNEVAQRELSELLVGLRESQEEINREAEIAMINAANKQEVSAETFLDAAEVIAIAANTLAQVINGSGNYVPVTTGEVF